MLRLLAWLCCSCPFNAYIKEDSFLVSQRVELGECYFCSSFCFRKIYLLRLHYLFQDTERKKNLKILKKNNNKKKILKKKHVGSELILWPRKHWGCSTKFQVKWLLQTNLKALRIPQLFSIKILVWISVLQKFSCCLWL